jgi:metal-dependent hydrolase (beta-lactamase superfamily II)
VLTDWNVGFVMPCHCSGSAATGFMRQALGSRVVPPSAGDTLEF